VYDVFKANLLHSGDSQLAATSEAQNVQTADAETTPAWNQIAQQHGATDTTDGPQSGYTQPYGISRLHVFFARVIFIVTHLVLIFIEAAFRLL